jgi:trk system potassium uptake protein TrkA
MAVALIVGAGKAGAAIAERLLAEGHHVRMIDPRPDHVAELSARLPAAKVRLGSGTDPRDLEAAEIRACDVVVAATGADEVNLVTTTLAKYEFGVERVVARVVDRRNIWLFDADLGVDVSLDETELAAEAVVAELGRPTSAS